MITNATAQHSTAQYCYQVVQVIIGSMAPYGEKNGGGVITIASATIDW